METENQKMQTLRNWVINQIEQTNFARTRSTKKASTNMSGGNGNLTVIIEEDLELTINVDVKGAQAAIVVVPKGSELVIFRTQAQAVGSDIVATIFTKKLQASLRGNGRTTVRTY